MENWNIDKTVDSRHSGENRSPVLEELLDAGSGPA